MSRPEVILACVFTSLWSPPSTPPPETSDGPRFTVHRDAARTQPIRYEIFPGDTLHLRYVDPAQQGAGVLRVTFTTLRGHDLEQAFLRETAPGSGEFRGTLSTAAAGPTVPGNHVLELDLYDWVFASYAFGDPSLENKPRWIYSVGNRPPEVRSVVFLHDRRELRVELTDLSPGLDPARIWLSVDGQVVTPEVVAIDRGFRLTYVGVPPEAQSFEVYATEVNPMPEPGLYCREYSLPPLEPEGPPRSLNAYLFLGAGGRAHYFLLVGEERRCRAAEVLTCARSGRPCVWEAPASPIGACDQILPRCSEAKPLGAEVFARAIDMNPLLNLYGWSHGPFAQLLMSPSPVPPSGARKLLDLAYYEGLVFSFGYKNGPDSAPRVAAPLETFAKFISDIPGYHLQGHAPLSLDQESFLYQVLGYLLNAVGPDQYWPTVWSLLYSGFVTNFGLEAETRREFLWGGLPFTIASPQDVTNVLSGSSRPIPVEPDAGLPPVDSAPRAVVEANAVVKRYSQTGFMPPNHSTFSRLPNGHYRSTFVTALTASLWRDPAGFATRPAAGKEDRGFGVYFNPMLLSSAGVLPFLANTSRYQEFLQVLEDYRRRAWEVYGVDDPLARFGGPYPLSEEQERLGRTLLLKAIEEQNLVRPFEFLGYMLSAGLVANFGTNPANGHSVALFADAFSVGSGDVLTSLVERAPLLGPNEPIVQHPCGIFSDVAHNLFYFDEARGRFRDPVLDFAFQALRRAPIDRPLEQQRAAFVAAPWPMALGVTLGNYYRSLSTLDVYLNDRDLLCSVWTGEQMGGASPLSDAQADALREFMNNVLEAILASPNPFEEVRLMLENSWWVVPVADDEAALRGYLRGGFAPQDTPQQTRDKLNACLFDAPGGGAPTRYYVPAQNVLGTLDLTMLSGKCFYQEFLESTTPREVRCTALNDPGVDLGGATTLGDPEIPWDTPEGKEAQPRDLYHFGPLVSSNCPSCAAQGLVCDEEANACVACVSDADCAASPDGPFCDRAIHRCGPCATDAHCGGNERVCNLSVVPHLCQPGCNSHDDCANAAGKRCDVQYLGPPDSSGQPGQRGRCIECLAHGDCTTDASRPLCDLRKHRCGQCLADPDCGGNERVCDTSGAVNICVAGCNDDADCAATTRPQCDPQYVGAGTPAQRGRCGECLEHADCLANPNGPWCDRSRGLCVQCLEDPHCGGVQQVCNRLVRVSRCEAGCNDDLDCVHAPGKVCDREFTRVEAGIPVQNGRCLECLTNAHCASHPNGRFCDPTTWTCGECNVDADCGVGALCATAPLANRCVPGCRTDADCASTPATPRCDPVKLRCGACNSDPDCPGPGWHCDRDANVCVFDCQACEAAGLVCDRQAGRCVGCLQDGDCLRSPRGPRCDLSRRTCEPCRDDLDCGGVGWVCGRAETANLCLFRCDLCTERGLRCDPERKLCAECLSRSDCSTAPGTPYCNEVSHRCEACQSDAHCPGPGWVCTRLDDFGRCTFLCEECRRLGLACDPVERRCVGVPSGTDGGVCPSEGSSSTTGLGARGGGGCQAGGPVAGLGPWCAILVAALWGRRRRQG
jgi:hypothetical protein